MDRYVMTMRPARKKILPGLRTEVLTYNGSLPGPVIRARSGRPVQVPQFNGLDNPASAHLHSGSVTPENDGGPIETAS